MQSKAATVEEYLAELTEDRREAIRAVRTVILKHLPKGYEEGMQYGMIGYYVPHDTYPPGYHCDPKQPLPYACLASQKNYMSLYFMGLYSDTEEMTWFHEAWAKTGKKLDMGKSCIRFKRVEDLPLEVIGQAIKRFPVKKYIEQYERVLETSGPKRARKQAAKNPTTKKPVAKKKGAKKKRDAKKAGRR